MTTPDDALVPTRIQRKRTKGWKMPPNTIYVGRPSVWGNPFNNERDADREMLVEWFRWWLAGDLPAPWHRFDHAHVRIRASHVLRGKNLACWCPLDQPCHADVLLELANG